MKIGIIGLGPSGAYAALKIKDLRKDFDIEIIEKENKPLKKLRATGNGHCNLLPEKICKDSFDDNRLIGGLVDLKPLLEQLEEWGIPLKHIEGQGYYPLSYSAPSYAELLFELLKRRGVEVELGTRVLDYAEETEGIILKTNKGTKKYDRLIIASGGKSHSELGSDGSVLEILQNHSIKIEELQPGLTPLRLVDNDLKELDGIRHEAEVSLISKTGVLYREKGEILYRKKGISGIVIFNVQREWAKRKLGMCQIRVDLFPDRSESELQAEIDKFKALSSGISLQGFFVEPLRKHILKRHQIDKSSCLAHTIKNLFYAIEGDEGFVSSQVTIGGVSSEELTDFFTLKKTPIISVIGEATDIDGKCGGNNLAYCLYSALVAAEFIAKK